MISLLTNIIHTVLDWDCKESQELREFVLQYLVGVCLFVAAKCRQVALQTNNGGKLVTNGERADCYGAEHALLATANKQNKALPGQVLAHLRQGSGNYALSCFFFAVQNIVFILRLDEADAVRVATKEAFGNFHSGVAQVIKIALGVLGCPCQESCWAHLVSGHNGSAGGIEYLCKLYNGNGGDPIILPNAYCTPTHKHVILSLLGTNQQCIVNIGADVDSLLASISFQSAMEDYRVRRIAGLDSISNGALLSLGNVPIQVSCCVVLGVVFVVVFFLMVLLFILTLPSTR
jgi:hypothetical protein